MHQRSPHDSLPIVCWRFPRRRVRPYLSQQHQGFSAGRARPRTEAAPAPISELSRVLHGLRALPDHWPPHAPPGSHDDRTPLVRFIDAERARTVADRTPTEEIPIVTAEGVSGR
jgi:hypothetical protein